MNVRSSLLKRVALGSLISLVLLGNTSAQFTPITVYNVTEGGVYPQGCGVCCREGISTCKILESVTIGKVAEYGPGVNSVIPNGGGLYVIWSQLKSSNDSHFSPCWGCGAIFDDNAYANHQRTSFVCPKLFTGADGTGTQTTDCNMLAGGQSCGVSGQYFGTIVDSKRAQVYLFIPTGYASVEQDVSLDVTKSGSRKYSGGYALTFNANPDPNFVGDMATYILSQTPNSGCQ